MHCQICNGELQQETWSVISNLEQFKWGDTKKMREVLPTDDFIPLTWSGRSTLNGIADSDSWHRYLHLYKGSFLQRTIKDWNALPESPLLKL